MKSKILVVPFLGILIVLVQAITSLENNENLSVLPETSLHHTIKQSKDEQPIVIHTQLKHYDQPTLKEYQECHENLESCKKVCEGAEHPNRCVQECPVCPLLIKEQIVVQGINDSDYSSVTTAPINTTNIIRLTNEIRNIIENHQGNITNFSENRVYVHQNVSRVGGKFGLGYNNTESCCIVISLSKDCAIKKFSTANACHRKRYRVCGTKCKSRVMIAKRVTVCEKSASYLPDEDYDGENCYETVKYVPHQSRKRESAKPRKRCSFSPSWPYVSCSQNPENFDRSINCKRCLGIPYLYILRKGIPEPCIICFIKYASPPIEIYTPSWFPVMPSDMEYNYLFEDDINYSMASWQNDKTKCRLPDGTISDKCEIEVSDFRSTTSDPLEILPDTQNDYLEYQIEENLRKRRHAFTRSKYSRRYR